ncbi:MAG TPA: hypothetical protein EYQ25_13450 [Planctomycetes bacterium]|nr:hypothetical protein [Planctomycetota bacterium]HIL38577.1 hypothetical protein [Planctomycetota bacterium]
MQRTDFWRLTRISLAPTAIGDPIAGMLLASHGDLPEAKLLLLIPLSLCLFHGGLVLNDWSDRGVDQDTRPDRPIPSGRVSPSSALSLALGLLLGGVLLGSALDPRTGLATLGLTLLIVAYDLGPRGKWLGPLTMGACRAGNVALAYACSLWVMGEPTNLFLEQTLPGRFLVPLAYGCYVVLISGLARAEDGDAALEPTVLRGRLLCAMTLLPLPALVAGVALHSPVGGTLGALLALSGAPGLWQAARDPAPWTRERVTHCVGLLLRRLLLISASIALSTSALGSVGLWAALVILAGYPLANALRTVAPPS